MTEFKKISAEQGISHSAVLCILQDSRGFMWFGTQNGLNRYDGRKFRIYMNNADDKSSLPGNYIKTIFEDKDDNIWIGTLGGGLSKFNRELNNFTNYHPDSNATENELITSICEDSDANLWIGCFEKGLIKYDIRRNKFYDLNKITGSKKKIIDGGIYTMLIDSNQMLWIGTWNKGIYLFDLKAEKFMMSVNDFRENNFFGETRIFSLFEDSKKNVWIGTSEGAVVFNNNRSSVRTFINDPASENSISQNHVSAICEDKDNNIWLATKRAGLNKLIISENRIERYYSSESDPGSISGDALLTLYCDDSNVLWAGTFGYGVSRHDGLKKKFYSINDLTSQNRSPNISNVISVLASSENDLWIGTMIDGLFKYDHKNNAVKNYKGTAAGNGELRGSMITCLEKDNVGGIWIGTSAGGLNKYDQGKDAFDYFEYGSTGAYRVHSICRDKSENILWLGTQEHGLLCFDTVTEKFINDGMKRSSPHHSSDVKVVFADSCGLIWVGTNKSGLIKYSPERKTVEVFIHHTADLKSISDNTVTVICEDKSSDLWIGTLYGGLNKFSRGTNKFERIFLGNDMNNIIISGIIADEKNNLWISSNQGIIFFNTALRKARLYDTSDGLINKEFNDGAYCSSGDGIFCFGGVNGVNYFKPAEITNNPYIPNIAITDFQIFNKSENRSEQNSYLKEDVNEISEINLSHRESVFSFEFAALSYNNPDKNEYAYKMEGFDKDWIYSGKRNFITYTNLEAGDYTFRVKGSNNDGVWNEEGTGVRMHITPPFWKTWWFRSMSAASAAGAAGLSYNRKLVKIEKERRSQEEFSKKLIDSQEQERKKIASELHDTIAHDILITKNKAVIGLRYSEDPEKIKSILNEISDISSGTLNDVRSISYNLNPPQLERLGLTKAIKSIVNRISHSTDIEFSVTVEDIDKLLSQELEINVFRILQECFNNILKHSKATRSDLRIFKNKESITILVSDNGIGFSNEQRYGLGLKGITERIKLYKGILTIESEAGHGTTVNINIPYKQN